MSATQTHNNAPTTYQMNEWFTGAISTFEADKFLMMNGLSHPDTKKLYTPFIMGDIAEGFSQLKKGINMYFVKNAVVEFLEILLERKSYPLKLAFSFSDSKVFIWAEIAENDEEMEDNLIEAETIVNAKLNSSFNISTTIIEDTDNIKIPSHYIPIPLKDLKAGGKF